MNNSIKRPGRNTTVVRLAVGNLIVFASILVLLELIGRGAVWFWNIPTEFEAKSFRDDGLTDPDLWWVLRPNVDTEANGIRLTTNPLGFRDQRETVPGDGTLIFCLGDSTTYGWRVQPEQMYTAIAQRQLRLQSKSAVSVVSAGVPGYTSYQCLRQAELKILPHQPDWVAVLASNNECRARSIGDRVRGKRLKDKYALQRLLGFSHFCTLVGRWPEAMADTWESSAGAGRVANTRQEYRENLTELVGLLTGANADVILMTVPIRYDFQPTWDNYDRLSFEVRRLLFDAEKAEQRGDSPLEFYHKALQYQPEQFSVHWSLAQWYQANGEPQLARRHLRFARENDRHPESTKPSYNEVVRRVAQTHRVTLVDLDKIFEESGRSESELFQDHCHPSVLGQELIGKALAATLAAQLSGPRAFEPPSNQDPER